METRLTCQGRSCHYLRVGRKPETLTAKSITLTTSTSAPAGSTPETGKGGGCVTFDLLQMSITTHTLVFKNISHNLIISV